MRDNRFTITLLITPLALSLLAVAVTQLASQAADAPAAPVKFTDVTGAAGIHFTQNAGRTGKSGCLKPWAPAWHSSMRWRWPPRHPAHQRQRLDSAWPPHYSRSLSQQRQWNIH